MITFFPKQFSNRAIALYLLALAVVSFVFFSYMLKFDFLILGIIWVVGFFLLAHRYTSRWTYPETKIFLKKLFITALSLRLSWVIISYFYFIIKTGIPFEFGASDSYDYHNAAVWFREIGWESAMDYLRRYSGVGDRGYPIYLTALYSIVGPNIIITRIIKALISSWTCILVYKLAQRNLGEEVGRMAGIFCCLMPNLIMYCGLHLKETEMIFLMVAALERADNLLRQSSVKVWNVILIGLLVFLLFTFRTVMAAAMIFAIFTALVFTSSRLVGNWNRVTIITWAVVALAVLAGGTIANEAEQLWNGRSSNQTAKRDYQVHKGYKWAEYATGAVMAPMIFVLPFPTMVDVDEQYNQQMMNGGNYVRNFLGVFVLIALFSAIFVRKNWRDLSLIGSYEISYLGIIASSGFANAERFLLPGLPILLIMAAYGVSLVNERNFRWVKIWYIVVPTMSIAWAFFKLGTRGAL